MTMLPQSPQPASPHTRGWTRVVPVRSGRRCGFPAHAGMDPARFESASRSLRLPRTRGDGPLRGRAFGRSKRASPHTRGWTRVVAIGRRASSGFPAHAGMDPRPGSRATPCRRLPRTRGDGPGRCSGSTRRIPASPHTRGWTPCRPVSTNRCTGFPAHAGMDPEESRAHRGSNRLPRTRGDGPKFEDSGSTSYVASPHTRGWTPQATPADSHRQGFPAHAGMDPMH